MLPYLREGGTVVTSTRPIQPVSAMIGGTPYDPGDMLAYLRSHAGRVVTVDADRALAQIGNDKVLNVLLLGIAAETGALGFDAHQLADAVKAVLPAKLHEINQKALAYARESMTGGFGS
jgi:indolepyruvate ferredoxin oxidoreductase beta subunit